MNRREPPLLATWALEHLAAGERDQALTGDLLEVFHQDESRAWYWHQVLSACALSWLRALQARGSLLVFAIAWSAAAPAWTAVIDRTLHNARILGGTWQMDWPFSSLSRFSIWIALNFVFLWSGILVYFLVQPRTVKLLPWKEVRRPFLVAAAILIPLYFWTFILMNLVDYPGVAVDRASVGVVSGLIDIRMWANVVRMPYFLTLLFALWQFVPRFTRPTQDNVHATPPAPPSLPEQASPPPTVEPADLVRFFILLVSAGLLNAMLAAVILCHLPNAHTPSISSLTMRAIFYVVTGALGGVFGTWLYWKHPSCPFRDSTVLPFPLFALVCAAGWVWVPPVVLFFEQVSPGAALVATIGAFILGVGLRSTTEFVFVPAASGQPWPLYGHTDLFVDSLYRPPLDAHGYIIALGLYAAGAALLAHSNYTAAALLALTAFLFGWKVTVPRGTSQSARQASRRAAARLARVVIPAVLVTAWALLEGVAHRNHLADVEALPLSPDAAASRDTARRNGTTSFGPGGFESLILWPTPPKKQILAPIPAPNPLLALGSKRPLVIRFDGDYRYVQNPNQPPGPHAHKSHASPLQVNIHSNNGVGVFMDAHQELASPIPISRCREIQVEVANEDNRQGMIFLGLLIKDSSSHKDAYFLGQQLIASTSPINFMIKMAPVSESLRFKIPAGASLNKFDEITVLILPDIEHQFVAPKIAIRQFELLRR